MLIRLGSITVLTLVISLVTLLVGCDKPVQENASTERGKPAAQEASQAKQYTCPMHPDVLQDAPGTCPQCGMDLVEKTG